MAVGVIMQTGASGLHASRTGIATTGHNISNVNSEGFSRQRVHQSAEAPEAVGRTRGTVGRGTKITRIDRVNDQYLEKQIRDSERDKDHFEEKGMMLTQVENVFNEMGGEGLNRLVTTFFNDFRKLSNDPQNEALRQSLREAATALVNDFKRLRGQVVAVRNNIDSRIEAHIQEFNADANTVKDLNAQIKKFEVSGGVANDLRDKRDVVLKRIAGMMSVQTYEDGDGDINVEVRGIGPLINGPHAEQFQVARSSADDKGKAEGAYDVMTTASAKGVVTHTLKGGKIGGLLEVRDQTLTRVSSRLDQLAYALTKSVNEIHQQGFNKVNQNGVAFFNDLSTVDRAAEFMDLSASIKENVNNIAAAAMPNAPGDNRIALAISHIQGERIMNDGKATMDDFYNSIISEVGVINNRNTHAFNQQVDMHTHLNKLRDRLSGVSLDEETANLMQYQHAYNASAKVIGVADEILGEILSLR